MTLERASREVDWLLLQAESQPQPVYPDNVEVDERFRSTDVHKLATEVHDSRSMNLKGYAFAIARGFRT